MMWQISHIYRAKNISIMRTFLTFLLFLGLGTLTQAQITLQIPDLARGKKIPPLAVSSADLTTVSIPNARGGGSSDATVWVITRDQDQYSNAIQDAANRGRAFKRVELKIGNNRHNLEQALISNFSISASGNSSTETFYIRFSNS